MKGRSLKSVDQDPGGNEQPRPPESLPQEPATTNKQELLAYVTEVAARALGSPGKEPHHPKEPETHSTLRQILMERAAQHVEMGRQVPPGARLRFLRRVINQVARAFTTEQIIFNRTVVAMLEQLDEELNTRTNTGVGALAAVAAVEEHLEELSGQLRSLEEENALLRSEISALRASFGSSETPNTDETSSPDPPR